MNYAYKSFLTKEEIEDFIKTRDHIIICNCLLVVNATKTYIWHIYPEDKELDIPDSITIEDLANVLKITKEELEDHINKFKTKKMYEGRDFTLKGLRNKVLNKRNKSKIQETRNKIISDLIFYFGSKEAYKSFMNHTLFASYKVKISMNQLYEYDNSSPIDFIQIELPVYPVNDKTWANEHKKDLFRYALIRLNYYSDFTKFKIPIKRLKLHSVDWDCEFINFTLLVK